MGSDSTVTSLAAFGDLSSHPYSKDSTSQLASQTKKRVSFGTLKRGNCAESGDNRGLGDRVPLVYGAPHLGPGCYENAVFSSFTYNLKQWKCSARGYAIGARTASRFPKVQVSITPSPAFYQLDCSLAKRITPSHKPFHSSEERFRYAAMRSSTTPGPGVYDLNVVRNKKVQWPQQFGAPIKPIQPSPVKRTIKTELFSDKEFRKYRNRVAYLSMYYN